jgi:membrane protein implicated in regulation of membrane protease activity
MGFKFKFNAKLFLAIVLSMADEAIILVIVLVVLSKIGLHIPFWAFAALSLLFVVITLLIYRVLRKNPQLGFENMIGLNGLAVEPVGRKGTVKIDGELWAAAAKEGKIEVGSQVIVIEQTGLKLTVIKNSGKDGRI